MNSRRQDINLRPSYVNQLSALEGRLFKEEGNKSTRWDDDRPSKDGDVEEKIVKNT